MNFYFDIECIPTQRQDFIDEVSASITVPGTYKKQESIEAWENNIKPGLVEKAVAESVFDGGLGEVIAFSCMADDSSRNVYRTGDSEASLLESINDIFRELLFDHRGNYLNPTWIGHYITGFDLRFLWKRFVVNKIKPAAPIPYKAKPWDENIFDTCSEWKSGSKDRGSMEFVCKVLGIEGKGDMDGSKVYDYWKEGHYKEISDYCHGDVVRTKEIYNALTFLKKPLV